MDTRIFTFWTTIFVFFIIHTSKEETSRWSSLLQKQKSWLKFLCIRCLCYALNSIHIHFLVLFMDSTVHNIKYIFIILLYMLYPSTPEFPYFHRWIHVSLRYALACIPALVSLLLRPIFKIYAKRICQSIYINFRIF